MIVKANVCSRCFKIVPAKCDGQVYLIKTEYQDVLVCHGTDDEENLCRDSDGILSWRSVRGHGDVDYLPVTLTDK